jgi:hypothetical protein
VEKQVQEVDRAREGTVHEAGSSVMWRNRFRKWTEPERELYMRLEAL